MSQILIDNMTFLEAFGQEYYDSSFSTKIKDLPNNPNLLHLIYALLFWDEVIFAERNTYDEDYLEQLIWQDNIENASRIKDIVKSAEFRGRAEVGDFYPIFNDLIERYGFDGSVRSVQLDKKTATMAEYRAAKIATRRFSSYEQQETKDFSVFKRSNNPFYSPAYAMQDVLYYHFLGDSLGLNNMVSDTRMNVLRDYLSSLNNDDQQASDLVRFSRLGYIDLVDKEMIKRYDEINKRANEIVFKLKLPTFIGYLTRKHGIETVNELFSTLIVLRNEKEIVDFRNAMDKMDKALNDGNVIVFQEYVKLIQEIADIIETKYRVFSFTPKVDITVFPTPSIQSIDLKGTIQNYYAFFQMHKYRLNILYSVIKYGFLGSSR